MRKHTCSPCAHALSAQLIAHGTRSSLSAPLDRPETSTYHPAIQPTDSQPTALGLTLFKLNAHLKITFHLDPGHRNCFFCLRPAFRYLNRPLSALDPLSQRLLSFAPTILDCTGKKNEPYFIGNSISKNPMLVS